KFKFEPRSGIFSTGSGSKFKFSRPDPGLTSPIASTRLGLKLSEVSYGLPRNARDYRHICLGPHYLRPAQAPGTRQIVGQRTRGIQESLERIEADLVRRSPAGDGKGINVGNPQGCFNRL